MIDDRATRAPGSGKLLGTCSQIGERTGVPVTLVRIGAVVALCCAFKLAVLAYCLAAIAFRTGRL